MNDRIGSSTLVYIGDCEFPTFYDRELNITVSYACGWLMASSVDDIVQGPNVEITDAIAKHLNKNLAILQSSVDQPYEMNGLSNIITDVLPTIKYYLRAIYPLRYKFVQKSILGLFDNFDVSGMVNYDIYTHVYRGIYYNGVELIVMYLGDYGRQLYDDASKSLKLWAVMRDNGKQYYISTIYSAILNERLNVMSADMLKAKT